MSDADVSWGALQEAFALGSPVLAIGPGCHRIGYDTSEEWQRVVQRAWLVWHRLERLGGDEDETRARRDFLSHLWQSRLGSRASTWDGSVRSGPSVGSRAPSRDQLEGAAAAGIAGEKAQVALATDLLCALVDATRALGDAVAAGSLPVIDWKLVRLPEPESEAGLLKPARDWLKAAAALAHDLAAIQQSRTRGTLSALQKYDLRRDEIDPKHLTVLKAAQIASALDKLVETCFGGSASALSGAVVEWLSDLFWHVMVAGTSVPLAQDELNFYLNLRGGDGRGSRAFSRPLPGEYRGRSGEIQPLRDDLSALLASYDSGVAPDDGYPRRDWTGPREAFARTMAATLLETWRSDGHDRLAIGLVSDYDLMHERALMQLVREDQGFHVVCPVVTNPLKADGEKATRSFEWLFGTYHGTDRRSVSKPAWQWLRDVPSMEKARPLGPVLLRLTGSPLFDVGRFPDEIDGAPPADVTHIHPAVLFSEHESVQAILSLTRPHGGEQPPLGLYHDLFGHSGLSWERRGWLFFGHRFADWLPRLQLLFTALMLGRQASPRIEQEGRWANPPENSRVAISRGFDWPEEALLTALDIGRTRADLADVAHYYDITSVHSTASQEDSRTIKGFLERVEARVENGPPPLVDASASTNGSTPGQRRVFVSYSQESGERASDRWCNDVRAFADLLNVRGIDTNLDQYDNPLNRDWSAWSLQQVSDADVVICLASPRYAADWRRTHGSGAAEEARALRAALKRVEQSGMSLLFVVLPGRSIEDIPEDMQTIHHVELDAIDREGIKELVQLLSGRAKYAKPEPEVLR